MVLGVRVHGDRVIDADVALDDSFKPVPVPQLLGVPLIWKMLSGTGGDDSAIRSNIIVRFMADPDDGFAPAEWQYGGSRGPAPPVVLARKDKLPFSAHDWALLTDYMSFWSDEACEAEDERASVSARLLSDAEFRRYVRAERENHPLAFLSLQFPLGSLVSPQKLSAEELNGSQGEVAQYSRDRVGVKFPERAVIALRPDCLTLLREPSGPSEAELAASEPAAKRQDTGEAGAKKEARKVEIERQEALTISRRFVECMYEDTFPEMGDLHLFGVGCEYRARATEVLAVWQGLVKNMNFTAEELAEGLLQGNLRERFEELTRKLADTRFPNASYAKDLIAANFAATEWDTL
ncbi:unnamed protein product [Polarella glacialis]|uniref:Uncharacterized protein n=1 Tax=Polarella glacialis TaxID=89957 RepID=A0A813I5Q0_POLGL|nr:unnamed protein product [Polarella glacialis]